LEQPLATRRSIIIGAGVVAAVAVASGAYWVFGQQPSGSGGMSVVEGGVADAPGADIPVDTLLAAPAVPDHVLGNAEAKVVVIEYLSPTCPHCAAFNNDVFPQFKTDYVDSGKVRFIPRPYIRNILDAVVFMLADAAGEARYHDVVNTFFRTQDQWVLSKDPDADMFKIAQQLGFTREAYDKALTNQTLFDGLQAMQKQAFDEFKVQGTPTFFINGKTFGGEQSIDDLKQAIDPLLA
jgi:protein-disulfide isomerase